MAYTLLDTEKNTNALSPGQFGGVIPAPGSVASIVTKPTIKPIAPITPPAPVASGTNDLRDANGLLVNPAGALYDRNTGAPIKPNPGSVADIQGSYNLTLTPEQQAAKDAAATYLKGTSADANQVIDPNAIYQSNLGMFQAQIDATNKIYADKLNAERIQGQGRIESRKFSQGRSGQIGSGTGEAGVNAVQDANTQAESAIQNEQAAAIGVILGKVREATLQETKDKTAAKKAGAEALLKFYDDQPTRKATALKPVIATLVAKGIDPSKLSPEDLASITNGLGVSKEDVVAAYTAGITAKNTADAEAKKNAADLEQTIAQTAKTKADTAMIGKMTPAEKANLAEKIREFGMTYALDAYKAEHPSGKDGKDISGEDVKQLVNKSIAAAKADGSWKTGTSDQHANFIMSLGGTPSDYGY